MFATKKKAAKNATSETITTNGLRDTTSTIIGYDDNGKLVSLNERSIDGPLRTVLFGYPKCGKSQAFLVPYLVQAVRRGETCLIGDDGDLYNATAEYFHSAGYRVRHIDFCDLANSDTCNLMQYIKHAANIQELQHRVELFSESLVATAVGDRYSNTVIEALSTLLTAVTMRVVLDSDMPSTLGEIAYVLEQGGMYIDSLLDSKKTAGTVRAALPVYERFLRQVRTCPTFDLNLLSQLLQRVEMEDLKRVVDDTCYSDGLAQLGQSHQVTFVSSPMNNPRLRGYAAAYMALCMDQERQGNRGGTANASILIDNAGDMGYYGGLYDLLTVPSPAGLPSFGSTATVLTFRNKAQVDHLYGTESAGILDAANFLIGCGINDADTAALFLNTGNKNDKKSLFGRQEKSALQERDLYSAGATRTFAVINNHPAVSCRQFGSEYAKLQNF